MDKLQVLSYKLNQVRESVDFTKNMEVFNDANANADLFDVAEHRYRLGPRLTENEITVVEQQCNIRLPEDYRAFLLEIGDGGAGPYYGLYPLARGIRIAVAKGQQGAMEHILGQPFPLVTPFVCPSHEDKAAVEAFYREVNRPEYVHGTLPLADFGCGINVLLVVTGQARGTLWLDDRDSDNGVWPLCVVEGRVDCILGHEVRDTTALQLCDFVNWYDAWLDERIDIHARYKRGEWKAPWTQARRNPNNISSLEFRSATNT